MDVFVKKQLITEAYIILSPNNTNASWTANIYKAVVHIIKLPTTLWLKKTKIGHLQQPGTTTTTLL